MTGDEFLQSVEKLLDVRRLVLAPGDTIAILMQERLTMSAYNALRESMGRTFPGHRVIVLECGMDICVVSDPAVVAALETVERDSIDASGG